MFDEAHKLAAHFFGSKLEKTARFRFAEKLGGAGAPPAGLVPRLGHNKMIGVIAHRLCHLIWIILHNGARYEERSPAVSEKSS